MYIKILIKYTRIKLLILNQVINKVLKMINTNIYIIYTVQSMYISMSACQPAEKCHTKKASEFKNNMVGHMTFSRWPAHKPGA